MVIKGQKINDRYQIIRTIGEGGMANVYLAYDTILDRNVAVKILRGDLASDEKFIKKFEREAISASSLSHPNIVEIYDVGEDDGNHFIVMEFIDGKTLKNLIKKRGSLTLPEVIDIMLQLTSAIACAHESYIIHRDIKPQNVMILDDGIVKITDFGIALATNASELTQTNSVMGSVHYLPPEQANGSGSTIRSDIYSLGILMYELITGKVPFKGDTAVEIAIKQLKEPMPSICKKNPDIPQSIENVIMRATAKNPKNRYTSAREMYDDILTSLDDERINEGKLVYKYPENDFDETKKMKSLKEMQDKAKAETNRALKEIEGEEMRRTAKKEKKVLNTLLWITGGIFLFMAAALLLFVIILPKVNTVKEHKIPDVSGMEIVEAEAKLKELGFEINTEYKEDNSSEIKEGLVIKTTPPAGSLRKEGIVITLTISLGDNKIKLEDYVGGNYYEVKGMLEEKGLYVLTKKEDVDKDANKKESEILKQEPAKGTLLSEGDTVTLYIPNIVTEYPDFKAENYTVDDIKDFCNEYSLVCTFDYKETDTLPAGAIVSQSRTPGSQVTAKASLRIVIAKEVTQTEEE